MPANKRKHDAFDRLADWLENGVHPLDQEMEESLADETYGEAETGKGTAGTTRSVPERNEKHRSRRSRSRKKFRDALTVYAYADAWWYRVAAVVVCASLIALLLFGVVQMPLFGNADTLVDSEVSSFYVTHTMEETGAMNIVTGIILDYRGFDTLGESHVLFVAVSTVLLLLSIRGEKNEEELLRDIDRSHAAEPDHDLVLQGGARLLLPLILIFGTYIILNGHLSPGGGFSGGAVLGAGLILYQNAFGYERIGRFFTYRTFRVVSVSALLFYALAKGYHFFTGANHLPTGIPEGTAGAILSGGLLLPLNIAVGCVVTCTMYALYTMFRRGAF